MTALFFEELEVLWELQWGFDLNREVKEGSRRKSLLGESRVAAVTPSPLETWGQGQKGGWGGEAGWPRALSTMQRKPPMGFQQVVSFLKI